jgi:hypothetical protein
MRPADPTGEVVRALRAAAAGTGLRVRACPELRGGVVVGERGDGYVFPAPGGWRVDLWRRGGSEPYRVLVAPALEDAVAAAVAGLLAH